MIVGPANESCDVVAMSPGATKDFVESFGQSDGAHGKGVQEPVTRSIVAWSAFAK